MPAKRDWPQLLIDLCGLDPNNLPKDGEEIKDGWRVNTLTTTCKCNVCGDLVKTPKLSVVCKICACHICSHCLDAEKAWHPWYHKSAENQIRNYCWHIFPTQLHPDFVEDKPPPRRRPLEELKAKQAKAKTSRTRNKKANPKQARASTSQVQNDMPPSIVVVDTDSNEAAGDREIPTSSFTPINQNEAKRGNTKRKRATKKNPKTKGSTHSIDVSVAQEQEVHLNDVGSMSEVTMSDEPHSSTDALAASIHKGQHTIIAGGGVVGLFIALELARRTKELRIPHNITVVEIRGDVCELASGASAGILSTRNIPDEWGSISQTAARYWKEFVAISENSEQVGFSTTALIYSREDGLPYHGPVPPWLRTPSDFSLQPDSRGFGVLNPKRLASWLRKQCEYENVSFLFNHKVADVDYDNMSKLANVYTENVKDCNEKKKLQCKNLVLAAGPFTFKYFGELFDGHSVPLENHVTNSFWYGVKLKEPVSERSIAVRFPSGAKGASDLKPEITMAQFTSEKLLAVSAESPKPINELLSPENIFVRMSGISQRLKNVVAKYLNQDTPDHVEENVSYLSTGNMGKPVIGKVRFSDLNRPSQEEEDNTTSGVYLCFGLGNHGTTLAPGAARMLVSNMIPEMEAIDTSDFWVPKSLPQKSPRERSQPPESQPMESMPQEAEAPYEGKGKGRA